MRKGTKTVLITKLAIFTAKGMPPVYIYLIDRNEFLYHVLLPKETFIKKFCEFSVTFMPVSIQPMLLLTSTVTAIKNVTPGLVIYMLLSVELIST